MDRARHSLRSRLHPGDDGASRLVAAFEHWHAGRDKGRPFFAFFNFLEPHAPYDPPGWRRELAAGDRRRAGALLEDLHRPADLMLPYNLGSQSLDDKDLAILRRLYEKEVSVADTAAGRVLDLLENAGEMDRTMVVLASDHGENIGEHHLLAHNMSLHETLLHVPLVIAGPGASQSHRPGTVSALGLHPTLVQVMSGREQEGSLLTHPAEDVASEYESARNQVRALGPLLKEIHRTANLPVLATHKGVAAYRGTYKAVAANHRVDVFNLSSDPVESVPLAGALVPDAKAASDAASAGLERLERRSQHTEETAVLDEEIRVHLEGLGYL
jgi:arylsulfatase A-like enzyme